MSEAVSMPISAERFVILDADDYEILKQWKWTFIPSSGPGVGYAARWEKHRPVYMHRHIMNPTTSQQVDHINGDGLDNRRANLRLCTPSQNQANRAHYKKRPTPYHGVTPFRGKFQARIKKNQKIIHLGLYQTPEEAARAYDAAATRLFGEFASLNFK